MIYITSDLHLNHKNIIAYCNRPFKTVDQMNSVLIKNWNNIISNDDIVYYLGDFALGPKESFVRFTQCLNGHKHFIIGNHDHISKNKILEAGWESVQYQLNINYNGTDIQLQHHPNFAVPNDRVLIYGHVHNNGCSEAELPHKSFCACTELYDYKPVSLEYALNNLTIK